MELKSKPICGDHLTDDCVCFDYLKEIESSAKRLIQLTQEREKMK
jgi:hypothetical protein